MKDLPSFGPYMEERLQEIAKHKKKSNLLDESLVPPPLRPVKQPKMEVPTVKVRTHQVEVKDFSKLLFDIHIFCGGDGLWEVYTWHIGGVFVYVMTVYVARYGNL